MRRLIRTRPLLCILFVALMLRIGAAFTVEAIVSQTEGRRFLIAGDADGYWQLASRIASGEPYEIYDPPRRVLRMPGFPALLAVSKLAFGESVLPARLLLALVGTGAVAAVYWLGALLLDRRTGLTAAGLAAISPLLVGNSVLVLSETLFALLMTGAIGCSVVQSKWLASGQLTKRIFGVGFAAGACHAAAVLSRPTWVLAFPVVLLIQAVSGPRRLASPLSLAASITGFCVLLAPWTYRNWVVTGGRFVPTTLWAGPSLYDGLNPEATGASDMRFFDRDQLMSRMTEYEMDREYRRRAWVFVKQNPWRTAELAAIKLWRFWRPWPSAAETPGVLAKWAIGLFESLVLISAAAGIWLNRRRFSVLIVTCLPVLYFAAVHALFVGSLRYRIPGEYPLLILSAAVLIALWDRLRPAPGATEEATA